MKYYALYEDRKVFVPQGSWNSILQAKRVFADKPPSGEFFSIFTEQQVQFLHQQAKFKSAVNVTILKYATEGYFLGAIVPFHHVHHSQVHISGQKQILVSPNEAQQYTIEY